MPHLADFPPMLLDERPLDFDEPGWIYEIKFDGYPSHGRVRPRHCAAKKLAQWRRCDEVVSRDHASPGPA
jgi:hypothetical protein